MSGIETEEPLDGQQGLLDEEVLVISPSSLFSRQRSPEFWDKLCLEVDRDIARIIGLEVRR